MADDASGRRSSSVRSKSLAVRVYEALAVVAAFGILAASGFVVWVLLLEKYPRIDHVTWGVWAPPVALPRLKVTDAFESRRIVCNRSRTPVTGTLYAELVEEPDADVEERRLPGGDLIQPAYRRISLGSARITLPPGCQERIRVWGIPPGLLPGHVYWYSPMFEVCDVLNQCDTRPWPAVRLPDEFLPGGERYGMD